MTPTAKALELLGPIRQALDQVRNTFQTHNDLSPLSAKLRITIACSDCLQEAVVIPLVLALRQRAPGVRIALRNLNPAHMEQQLASGEIDLAIAMPCPDQPHLRNCHLFNETYLLIGLRDYPFLKAGLTIDEYVQLEQVIVSRLGGGFATPIDDALAAALRYQRKIVMSAASFLFLPEIVSTSALVALAPRRLLHSQLDRLKLIEIPWLAE